MLFSEIFDCSVGTDHIDLIKLTAQIGADRLDIFLPQDLLLLDLILSKSFCL